MQLNEQESESKPKQSNREIKQFELHTTDALGVTFIARVNGIILFDEENRNTRIK